MSPLEARRIVKKGDAGRGFLPARRSTETDQRQREADSDSLALRVRGAGKKQEVMPVEAFLARVAEEVHTRALAP